MKGPTRAVIANTQALATGIPKYCASTTFSVAKKTYTAAEAETIVTTFLDAINAVGAAAAALQSARIAAEKALAQDKPLIDAMRSAVALMFIGDAVTLAAFNMKPKLPRAPLSNAARVVADAKAAATRKARGTMGKKQREAISGQVTGVTITPISGAGAPPVTPAPAPVTSASTASVTTSVTPAPVPVTSATGGTPMPTPVEANGATEATPERRAG